MSSYTKQVVSVRITEQLTFCAEILCGKRRQLDRFLAVAYLIDGYFCGQQISVVVRVKMLADRTEASELITKNKMNARKTKVKFKISQINIVRV